MLMLSNSNNANAIQCHICQVKYKESKQQEKNQENSRPKEKAEAGQK